MANIVISDLQNVNANTDNNKSFLSDVSTTDINNVQGGAAPLVIIPIVKGIVKAAVVVGGLIVASGIIAGLSGEGCEC